MHRGDLQWRGVIQVEPINLKLHADECLRFRGESFIESYGNSSRFWGADHQGGLRYLQWLERKMSALPGSCCHAWIDGRIVGQFEAGSASSGPSRGWIYLIYVVTEWRRRGIGGFLLGKAEDLLSGQGLSPARLRVSPSNGAAAQLYSSRGWTPVGQPPDDEGLLVMEKELRVSQASPQY